MEAVLVRDAPSHYSWRRGMPVTAGLGRRALALAVDALVVILLTYLFTFFLASVGLLSFPSVSLAGGTASESIGLFWLVTLLELPVSLVYFTVLEGRGGRTLGKLMTGVRAVQLDGTPMSFFDAFLRNLLRLLWMTPVGVAFVFLDAYVVHLTEMEQRIGDLAAGTVVVVDEPVV